MLCLSHYRLLRVVRCCGRASTMRVCVCPQCLARACTSTGVSLAPRTTTTSDTCCSESRTPACPTRRRRPCACPCQRPARRPGQRQCVVTTRWRRSVPRHKPAPDRPRLAAVHSAARAAANLLMGPSSAPAAAKHARRGAQRSKIFQLSSFRFRKHFQVQFAAIGAESSRFAHHATPWRVPSSTVTHSARRLPIAT